MTRGYAVNDRPEAGWAMSCDKPGCFTMVGPRPSQHDLPLDEFVRAGWYIAEGYGDRCPACVKAEGGIVLVCRVRALFGGSNAPHSLMPKFPERVQRQRVKGWRMPEGAVYVGRGSKWGSPFKYRTGYALVRYQPSTPEVWEYEGRISADGMTHPYYAPDGTITDYRVRYATRPELVELYERTLLNPDRGMLGAYPSNQGHLLTYWTGGRKFQGSHATVTPDLIRHELAGKPLACWCKPTDPCHADVLLAVANLPTMEASNAA